MTSTRCVFLFHDFFLLCVFPFYVLNFFLFCVFLFYILNMFLLCVFLFYDLNIFLLCIFLFYVSNVFLFSVFECLSIQCLSIPRLKPIQGLEGNVGAYHGSLDEPVAEVWGSR